MALYTFIVDYNGGTYISQITAPNPKSAVRSWADNFPIEAVPGLGAKSKQELIRILQRDEEEDGINYVLIDGLTNTWCASHLVRGKLMSILFVETSTNRRTISKST